MLISSNFQAPTQMLKWLPYRQQTLTGILTGHSIHIHLYRIQVCHVVSCTEINAHTLVADTRAGLISQ